MRKKFNDTGLCISKRHYMVDISNKIEQITRLVEDGEYFTINRPRQYGKTTILSVLAKELNRSDDYLALKISFEAIDTETHLNNESFIHEFLMLLHSRFEIENLPELAQTIENNLKIIKIFPDLSRFITQLALNTDKHLVLLIDEVDKSSNNQLFLDFLAMLRNKYLQRDEDRDHTFHSIILAGVHDVKTLKTKIRPDDIRKYNSPWNIAIDFTVDLSFNPDEISTMITGYSQDKQIKPDIPAISSKLFYYTSGYPYLVSKLCKFIDEQIIQSRKDKNWSVSDVDQAFKIICNEAYSTTLFDSMNKNLENNKDLYDLVFDIVVNGRTIPLNIAVPVIYMGVLYGIFRNSSQGCKIHNRIFEQRIYHYMITKSMISKPENPMLSLPDYYTENDLDVKLILERFQIFMKEHSSNKDEKFLEREGRLLFLSFLRPIINSKGFEFKEPNVGDERRMDIVITYKDRRYVIELKRWYGQKAHEKGLQQLSDYLDMYSLNRGFLLIYDFNKNKKYKQEEINFQDKQIFAVWV
ncbi:AAA-like domain-containing protein [Desulfobacterales bacterium HSG17]|nr:AAA-like domain-containing protein [Desulfobacterales bacterium HSG17]